jgi:hypothetical protein
MMTYVHFFAFVGITEWFQCGKVACVGFSPIFLGLMFT